MNNSKHYLTHYFMKGTRPFLSLTKLNYYEASIIADRLKTISGRAFRRFNNFEWYFNERVITEDWLINEFISLGGKPKTRHPIYFVLGESSHLEEAYGENYSTIKVALDEINDLEVSFTYPDSMATRFISRETDAIHFNSQYHGKLFTKQGIFDTIDKFGMPGEQWRSEPKRKFDYFIEAQVWNEQYIAEYM
ncbi:hypothetical protein GCM10010912_16490 [Paenibacillus albidus]|uniref:Uncharacterized protein n=2 Tax=Paenibacillus albidus TaxID=2041023 RepID=A0A917C618_9BACL|nr:hypothetical protein GCM10010912_16490 [Paenibacillus albidus]